jgi:DNA-binding Lrp family transcriptional regulator
LGKEDVYHPRLKEPIEEATGYDISFEGIYMWIVFLSSKQNMLVPVPNRYFGVFEDDSNVIKEGTEDKIELLLNSLRPALLGQIQSRNREVSYKLTLADYTIMKQVIINPRLEIGDIAAATAISPKTVRRRLDKMIRNHVLEFSVLPNPDAMKGYVIFFLDVKIKNRGNHQLVLQRIYEELHEHFMPLSSDMSNQEDSIGLLLGSEDAIGIESIRSKIECLDGVEQANAFLPIKLDCPQEWILKAIDKKIAESSNERMESSENIASRMH